MMLYFLCFSYEPNTATHNRMLAYWRNLDRMKIPVKLVFFMPNEKRDRIADIFDTIKVEYCWDHFYINNRFLKYISFFLYQYLFLARLKKGDKVCIFGLEKISNRILKKNGVELYLESTECPEVYDNLRRIHNPAVQEYIGFCKKASALFVISSALKDYYIEKGVDKSHIHILNMTVDSKRFENIRKDNLKEKYIAYCGNVSNNKDGVDKLIRAFAIVVKKYPDYKLYIIGESISKAATTENFRLIQDLGITDNIVFTGRIPAEQMPQLLKNSQILALARPNNKQAKYGFPTKLGEYLMTENPVVVTSVGDIPLFLEDGVSAMISSPDNDEEFAAKLIWVIEHPKESEEIGKRGKEVALNCFNATIETKKMMDVICKS